MIEAVKPWYQSESALEVGEEKEGSDSGSGRNGGAPVAGEGADQGIEETESLGRVEEEVAEGGVVEATDELAEELVPAALEVLVVTKPRGFEAFCT